MTFGETSEPDREAILAFANQALDLSKIINAASSVLNETDKQLTAIKEVVERSTDLDPELLNEVRKLELELTDINEKFNGDRTKSRRNESAYPGFMSRLSTMMLGAMGSTEGPTGTHMQQYDIVSEEYAAVAEQLNELVNSKIPALNTQLDEAGAPWTPGRKIPDLK